jgi:hypothetical protein
VANWEAEDGEDEEDGEDGEDEEDEEEITSSSPSSPVPHLSATRCTFLGSTLVLTTNSDRIHIHPLLTQVASYKLGRC